VVTHRRSIGVPVHGAHRQAQAIELPVAGRVVEGTRHVIGVDEALTIARAGYAVLPPRNDGTKAPAIPWRKYEHQPPDEATITEWYGRGRDGIGIICGASSGNLEMLELEGRAVEDGMLDELYQRAEEHGLSELLYRVTDAYMERSPSGCGRCSRRRRRRTSLRRPGWWWCGVAVLRWALGGAARRRWRRGRGAVPYLHLTLPTPHPMEISAVDVPFNKKEQKNTQFARALTHRVA